MAIPQAKAKPSPAWRDWKLGLVVGLLSCTLAGLVWLHAGPEAESDARRPKPVWLDVKHVNAQLETGQVLAFKVGLQVKKPDDLEVLTPHVPALQTLLQALGESMSKEDLMAEDGLAEFGRDIRRNVNNYLRKHRVEPRVVTVAFEDIFLNP